MIITNPAHSDQEASTNRPHFDSTNFVADD
jgi:hypothetical protein